MRVFFPQIALAVCVAHFVVADEQPADTFDPEPVVTLLELVIEADDDSARECLNVLAEKTQTGEISGEQLQSLKSRLADTLQDLLADKDHALYEDAVMLGASWKIPQALDAARVFLSDEDQPTALRIESVRALISAGDSQLLDIVTHILADDESRKLEFLGQLLQSLGRLDDPAVAGVVLKTYSTLEEDLQSKAIELLTQRPAWSKPLLEAIGRGEIPASALNVNQVTRMMASPDEELQKLVRSKWGSVRTARDPEREKVVARMRELILNTPGDPFRGRAVFNKLCGQCHRMYGEGHEVGPDITDNGRASFEQLLSNVFDPSLVIGADYQARTVITIEGRVLSGLVVEDGDERVVLKMQGGKLETIPRDDIETMKVSQLSLMPENLEDQLKPRELADLFEFLTLDKPPEEPEARYIPGSRP